jgi:exodeoxyribonuclease VII large subunit
MSEFVYTVSDVNRYAQRILSAEEILSGIRVRGEISNYKVYASGHRYFTLKDSAALIRCVWFRGDQRRADAFRDGMRVIARGDVGLYVRDGQYQLTVRDMESDGAGRLYEEFELLKARLEAEGLFDSTRKRPLPAYPRRIGVVTSAHGAAVRDIIRVAGRRGAGVTLVLYPVQVQGEGAAAQIAAAIDEFSRRRDTDALIVGRGGGSIEDLWAFNEEIVARAIFRSAVPVISAVGPETDFTIADFVAHDRAATPSAAAELAVPPRRTLDNSADPGRVKRRRGRRMDRACNVSGAGAHAGAGDSGREGDEDAHGAGRAPEAGRPDRGAVREAERRAENLPAAPRVQRPSGALRRGYAMILDERGDGNRRRERA